jgi:hypothetical protein
MYVQCNCRALSCINCSHGNAISITHSECVFIVVVIQHSKRMAVSHYNVASLAVPYFFMLSHKRHQFCKEATERKMRVLIL